MASIITNYTLIDNKEITNIKLSNGAYRCHNFLLSMCYGLKDTCYPSIKYIANSLGTCTRTIDRYLKELVKLGLIIKRRRGSISNIYTLLHKKAGQVIEKVQEVITSAKKAYKSNYKPYTKIKESVFNDFEQRTYDYDNLEEKLLGWS